MAQTILMPKLGQTVEESTIVKWHKKEGDKVAMGEVIFEIETDKAVLQVESFYEGTLIKIYTQEGQTVPVQSVVAYLGNPGEKVPDTPPTSPAAAEKPKEAAAPAPAPTPTPTPAPKPEPVAETPAPAPTPAPAAAPEAKRFKISPRARKLAKDCAVDPSGISGTGQGGRVVERDVKAYLEEIGYNKVLITPTAKLMAGKEGLNILNIEGTGLSGRITVQDVNRAVEEMPKEMSKIRKIIAQRLSESFQTAPHFFVTVAVDMTDILAYRGELKKQGLKLSVTDFILKAVTMSLVEHPELNSSTDGESVAWSSRVHLGLAVSIDGGLVVPVIRGAEELTIDEIHDLSGELIAKAREGTLAPEEMSGSTFTISNMGMLNVENFTAIINPGESAILAVSSTVKKPVVIDDEIKVRSIMKITLSSDHRIVDGALAAQFANAIKNKLEDMELWKNMI